MHSYVLDGDSVGQLSTLLALTWAWYQLDALIGVKKVSDTGISKREYTA